MTIRKLRSCRFRRIPEVSLLAMAIAFAPAQAGAGLHAGSGMAVLAEADPEALGVTPANGAQELYLEVTINQVPARRLARFVLDGGQLHASAATLRELGLRWPGSDAAQGLVPLDEIPGLELAYDAGRQQVSILVPLGQLDGGHILYSLIGNTARRLYYPLVVGAVLLALRRFLEPG